MQFLHFNATKRLKSKSEIYFDSVNRSDLEPPSSPATLLPVAIGGDRGDVLNAANLHTGTSESPKSGLRTCNAHQAVQDVQFSHNHVARTEI